MTFGLSYQEVRKNEGSRNQDSTVLQKHRDTVYMHMYCAIALQH